MVNLSELIDFKTYQYNWDAIHSVPEFAVLESCEQSKKWHGEGNVWKHTKKVCEYASDFAGKLHSIGFKDSDVKIFLASALFHDIGKGVTTKKGKDNDWHSYGHEVEGEKITRYLLWNEGYAFREKVCAMVRWHMEPLEILSKKNALGLIADLSKVIPSWNLLIHLKICDILGSNPSDESERVKSQTKLFGLTSVVKAMNCADGPSDVALKSSYDFKYLDYAEDKRIHALVMIGLPGAGKSTYMSKFRDGVIVSRDIIRAELGYCKEGEKVVCTAEQEENVTKAFNEKMLRAAKEKKTIIIDNINLKKKYRDAYKEALKDYSVLWEYVYIEAPSISDNFKRREGQISEDVFKNMIYGFDWPYPTEYSFIEYHISDDEKDGV